MNLDSDQVVALSRLINVLSDGMFIDHTAPNLTCNEADDVMDFLLSFGATEAAENWLHTHAQSDEPDDDHYREKDAS